MFWLNLLNYRHLFLASILITAGPFIIACRNNDIEQIAFVTNRDEIFNLEIYLMNADGTNPVNLTNNPADDHSPAWSPDGKQIVFVSDRDGDGEIFVMNSDGSSQRQLTNNSSYDGGPVWKPDGAYIAFTSDRDSIPCLKEDIFTTTEVYIMSIDGSEQTRVTNNLDSEYTFDWSAISDQIVIGSNHSCSTKVALFDELYIINSNGETQAMLTSLPDNDAEAMWSHDGKHIIFKSVHDGHSEIYVMDNDGSNQTRLTFGLPESANITPAWSQDDSQIVFASRRDGNYEIYVMNSDGTEQIRLTDNPDSNELSPVWRP